MLTRLILWFSLSWIPVLMFFMLRSETRFKKNIVVEVTLPFQARTDTEVLGLLGRFTRRILWLNLILFLITILFLFIEKMSLLMTAWMTWTFFVILLPVVPYVRTNLALKRIKVERGWKNTQDQVQYVDLSVLPSIKWMSHRVFIPAIVISFLPLLWDKEIFQPCFVFGFLIVFFWFCYRCLYRNKSEMVDRNVELTRVLTQVRRHNWGIVWLISSYGVAALSLIFSLFKYHPVIQLVLTLLIVFVVTISVIRVEFKTRQVQARLTVNCGKEWYVDDDDYWPGGVVYYNPNDSRLLVNSRVGTNSTVNLAKTSGKIIAGLIILLLLAMPFTGLFLKQIEVQPLNLALTEYNLVAHRGNRNEALALSDIAEIKLLPELPDNMNRNWGTAMDSLLSGCYSIQNVGRVEVSLDPNVPPFLLVRLKDDSHYLIGSRQTGEAEAVYRQLEDTETFGIGFHD
jgi:uncharacterized membrane protein